MTQKDFMGIIGEAFEYWHDLYVEKKMNPSDKTTAFLEECAWGALWALVNSYEQQYGELTETYQI